jgi:DNA-binding XRE family transcriptional regulator
MIPSPSVRAYVCVEPVDLSASDFGKLLRVSAQSIYNWEAEKARPRPEQIVKLAALRGLGKREVATRLEKLAAT